MADVPVTISRTSPSHSSTHHSLWCTFCTKWPQELSTWQESYLLWVCSSSPHPCHGTCQSRQAAMSWNTNTALTHIKIANILWGLHCLCFWWDETNTNALGSLTLMKIPLKASHYSPRTLHFVSAVSSMFLAARSLWMKPFLERYSIASAISWQNLNNWFGRSASFLPDLCMQAVHQV